MHHGRRDERPTFLEFWGTPILFLLFIGCLIGIYYIGRNFL